MELQGRASQIISPAHLPLIVIIFHLDDLNTV